MKHSDVPIPKTMRSLPVTENGYLKPWFVKADDFRVVDEDKAYESMFHHTCWICGKPNDKGPFAFVTGPKSAAANLASEPPCHQKCAEYAVRVCPFILLPKAKRRDAGLTKEELAASPAFDAENPGEYYITLVKKFNVDMFLGMTAKWKDRWIVSRNKYVEGKRVQR